LGWTGRCHEEKNSAPQKDNLGTKDKLLLRRDFGTRFTNNGVAPNVCAESVIYSRSVPRNKSSNLIHSVYIVEEKTDRLWLWYRETNIA